MIGLIKQFPLSLQPVTAALIQILQTDEDAKLTERRDFDFWPAFINMLAVLAILIGLIVLLGWLLRRFGGPRFGGRYGGSGAMELTATLPLGDKRSLAIVRVGARYYLIGIGAESLNNLAELDADEVEKVIRQEKSAPVQEGGFAAIFNRFTGGKREDT